MAKPGVTPHEIRCPFCGGTGCIINPSHRANCRKGGNQTVLNSRKPGALFMRERGKRGGRPRALTLADIEAMEGGAPKKGASLSPPLPSSFLPDGE
jgi:hypothetical protein